MASVILEEYELMGDPKYRNYVSAVDKVLKNFEYTSEWADLISALGKLNKVLLNNQKYPVVPRRIVISKRLAQCLHPALPSGVHLKALETYDIVFKCIGTNRLSQELFIYSAGLFPLLGNAAMNVRPKLLDIYETHFVPLADRLCPGLSGFLIGVLSGLEEGSEYHDRTSTLLEKVCEGVEPSFFYGCLWKCVLTNPSVRLPATLYVMGHFNKKQNMEDQLHIMGTNVDTLVQALCAAVQDSSVLVQRSVLDLLIVGFPMHNSQLIRSDMEQIQTAAVGVVLRRDMSLNRRLYAWLLGTEVNNAYMVSEKSRCNSVASNESGTVNFYFDTYSRDLLIHALRTCLKSSYDASRTTIDIRPYRILISLLDKPEIGSEILDDILIEVFRALYRECNCGKIDNEKNKSQPCSVVPSKVKNAKPEAKNCSELLKTANLLFSTLEPHYIWEYVGNLYRRACSASVKRNEPEKMGKTVTDVSDGDPTVLEICEIIGFLLDIVSIESYVETQTEHLPELLRHLGSSLTEHCTTLTAKELTATLRLCSHILTKVQPPVVSNSNTSSDVHSQSESKDTLMRQDSTTSSIVDEVSASTSSQQVVGKIECSEQSMDDMLFQAMEEETSISESQHSGLGLRDRDNELDFINLRRTPEGYLHHSLIHNCVKVFQEFFVQFVYCCILADRETFEVTFNAFLTPQQESHLERKMRLEQMLEQCLRNCGEDPVGKSHAVNTFVPVDNLPSPVAVMAATASELTEAYVYASLMLVEFSSFPMYCSPESGTHLLQCNQLTAEGIELPQWLQVLMVMATADNLELQFNSISTLLDLITITRSVANENSSDKEMTYSTIERVSVSSSGQGTVSVVIIPLLAVAHLAIMDNHTRLYQIIAKQLWDQLSERSLHYQRQSTKLLHQLHSLTPNDNIVEDVMGHYMSQGNELLQAEGFRRFAVLWHLTRDIPTNANFKGTVRMYDRCLFIMLDCLHQDVGPQRMEVQSWLTHSLQRGDIARILEPILFILLHPDTARVSVQHISIQQPQKVRLESEDNNSVTEAKIYAISSVKGHVFYHVSDEPRQTNNNSMHSQKRVVAMTSIEGESASQVVTANAGVTDFDLPSSLERGLRAPILLFINPIGGLSWNEETDTCSTPDISNARRIDVNKLHQDSSFDDLEASDSKESVTIVDETKEELGGKEIVKDVLDEILKRVFQATGSNDDADSVVFEEPSTTDKLSERDADETKFPNKTFDQPEDITIHPLHTHLLLYCQVYDSQRVLYALGVLRSMLQSNPRLALCTLSTSSPSSAQSPRHHQLHYLLARHRRSVFGKGFHSDLPQAAMSAFRSSMLLEILLSVCLYFIRSFYPNLAQMRLTEEEISGNREVQLVSVELLTLLLSELLPIVKDSGRGFSSYIYDLLSRCRVQKALLHGLLSNVYAAGNLGSNSSPAPESGPSTSFTEAILDFNEVPRRHGGSRQDSVSDYSEAFQISLLRLLLVLIILEDEVTNQKGESEIGKTSENGEHSRTSLGTQGSTVRYQQGLAIPSQPMFLTAILCAIKQQKMRHLHHHWLALVASALPFLGRALSQVVITIINQLCQNLEALVTHYRLKPEEALRENLSVSAPVDYVMTLLDGMTTLCHYCVLDSPNLFSTVLTQTPVSTIHHPYMAGSNAGQIITNLINVFTPSVVQKDLNSKREFVPLLDPLISARRGLLSHLPRIISALSTLWQVMQVADKFTGTHQHPCWIMGTPKAVKQRVLELLSPIAHHHGMNFMGAVAVAWTEKRKKGLVNSKRAVISASEEQLVLVNLISAIKVMPMDTLIQTVRQVIKQPPQTNSRAVVIVPLEVSMLQFFLSYVQTMPGNVLLESWASLLGLLKEGLQLGLVPPAQFLLLGILNEFVQRAPMLEDKKDQKDLQDLAQKLIEAVSSIAGACLEQTTWLRRSLAVRPGPQPDIPDSDSDMDDAGKKNEKLDAKASFEKTSNGVDQYSVQALSILAELLAPMLDVIYVSDEKEKVIPLLNNIMYNVTPYLRNHSQHNIPSFRSCSQLLANLSSYQYTRKAWRKDSLELLLDASFFQMTEQCFGYWKMTVDNLMTHEKTTFRDLMAKVAMTQSGSLNLFSTKEQEYEQRAQLLKRVAFVIFSGEMDQYQHFIPDIQERLSESLRFLQVPFVQSQVFFCFRVLLLRMSPHHITSLWPIIITEMVQVFLQIEQELNNDSEEFSSHIRRLSALDSSWVVSPNNGLNAHNHPAWLQLYLAVCKLLDIALALPADMLPQFQMYRWAFVGENEYQSLNNNSNKAEDVTSVKSPGGISLGFMPHITRIARLLNKKVPSEERLPLKQGHLLISDQNIRSLLQLQPFFNTLMDMTTMTSNTITYDPSSAMKNPLGIDSLTGIGGSTWNKESMQAIEKVIQRDFLEPLVAS